MSSTKEEEKPVIIFGIVQVRPKAKTKRDRELHNSEVRSHAMKVVHERRRNRKAALKKEDTPVDDGEDSSSDTIKPPPSSPAISHDKPDASDAATAIEIPAELSESIGVWKDYYGPRMYINRFALQICGKSEYTPDLGTSVKIAGAEFFATETCAMKEMDHVGGWAALELYSLWHTVPPHQSAALRQIFYQTRQLLLQRLRESIEILDKEDPQQNHQLLANTARLLRISCVEGDAEAARLHFRIGSHIHECLPEEVRRSLRYAIAALISDVDPATRQMRRPLLDHAEWIGQSLQPFWGYCANIITILKDEPHTTHMSVGSPVVRDALQTTRVCARLCADTICIDTHAAYAHLVYKYTLTASYYAVGQLLHHYHDLMDLLQDSREVHTPDASHAATQSLRHVEIAMALTSLYIIRKCTMEVIVDGKDMHDIAYMIFPLIQQSLEETDYPMYRQATFWMLFCGAHHERRVELGLARQSEPPLTDWFRRHFAKKAQELRIRSWTEARGILEQFAFLDFIQPTDHETWFAGSVLYSLPDDEYFEAQFPTPEAEDNSPAHSPGKSPEARKAEQFWWTR